jgi:hypothetical protein
MATTFRDLIAANRRNSALLVAGFILFTVVVALVLAMAIIMYLFPGAAVEASLWRSLIVGGIAAVVAGLFALFSYWSWPSPAPSRSRSATIRSSSTSSRRWPSPPACRCRRST